MALYCKFLLSLNELNTQGDITVLSLTWYELTVPKVCHHNGSIMLNGLHKFCSFGRKAKIMINP